MSNTDRKSFSEYDYLAKKYLRKPEYDYESLAEKYLNNQTIKAPSSNESHPNSDIHKLFSSFNKRFFWSYLNEVEVSWSNRMTRCAGICEYRRTEKFCYIRLSSPLLKLRPHSDLVDTLLHEMIHAFLFLTNKDHVRDDGHGPNFLKHKDRINKEAGTNITVYHSFHMEVAVYQQHWWRCNGPCQHRPPYFGMVKRSMNRAPGPSNSWLIRHNRHCSGTFIKIREPTDYSLKIKKGIGEVKGEGFKGKCAQENKVSLVDSILLTVPNNNSALSVKNKNIISADTIDLTEESETETSNDSLSQRYDGKRGLESTVSFKSLLPPFEYFEESEAKKFKMDNTDCYCPVCNAVMSREDVAEHLENCDDMKNIFDFEFDLLEDIEDGDEANSEIVELNKSYQYCPICSSCIEGDLKSHVDHCLSTFGFVNVVETSTSNKITFSNDNKTNNFENEEKHCPTCFCMNSSTDSHVLKIVKSELLDNECKKQTKVPESKSLEKHFDNQTKISNIVSIDDSFSDKCVTGYNKVKDNGIKYPVYNKNKIDNVENHIPYCTNGFAWSSHFEDQTKFNNCLSSPVKIFDKQIKVSSTDDPKENTKVIDLTEEQTYCPICSDFISKDMNSHLKRCLGESLSVDDGGPVIEVSDSESPVKFLNNNSKFPLPKSLDTDNNSSERRIACRICGMKFGVTKFNGHVCYK